MLASESNYRKAEGKEDVWEGDGREPNSQKQSRISWLEFAVDVYSLGILGSI